MSNIYPPWWDTTLTIFNRYQDPQTQIVMWYKYPVSGCFWKYVGDKITINETELETNNIICRIRKHPKFLEKYMWVDLSNNDKSLYFTLAPGDLIIKGEVTDIINEYASGHRSSDVIAKYKALQGCMEIQSVSINVGAGRCDEHYFVKGI